jgi:hypothetical protein
MRELIIDKAPGKELIEKILRTNSFNDVNEFYKIRVDWYGYPLIHDRMITYGLFQDLVDEMHNKQVNNSKFIDYAIKIAESETDKRFLNAIFFILNFCTLAEQKVNPTADQINRISALKERVQKLSFFPNMTTFWERILDYLIKEPTFIKNEFMVYDEDYKIYFDLNFQSIDDNTEISCPIENHTITKEIEGIEGEYEPLKFVRSAKIDEFKYWVWLYKNITGNVWNWYITVRQDEKGDVLLERHSMHGGVTKTPEKLLLNYHYNS